MSPVTRKSRSPRQLLKKMDELRARLIEAEETLRAIREGEVDAIVVSGTGGEKIFSLTGTEQIYRLIVETMKEAAFTATFDGTILFANAQFGQFVKRPLERVLGHPLREFVFPDNQDTVESFLTISQKQSLKRRLVFQSADGTRLPTHVSSNILNQPDGMSICVVATDLTELENSTELIQQLRRQQEALYESQALLRAVMEGTPDPIYVKDRESRILMANPALSKVAGKPIEEILTKADGEYYGDPAVGRVLRDHDLHVMDSGQSTTTEETVPTPRGRRTFLSTKTPHRNSAGDIVGIIGISHDITERKQAEEALKRALEELARSNKDLEQFAYSVSHDLQEPLRMISGFVRLLSERYKGTLDAKADDYIALISEGTNRMHQMIEDLLAYSRVSSGQRQPAPVDFASIVEHAKENLGTSIAESDAAISVEFLPTLMVDASQMVQVFQNLIGNALKFRAVERPPQIHVGARQEADSWLFHVRDNGIGIEPGQADRVFGLFQRLHTRNEYPGTGVGLAICKRVIERHGGRIWVESQPGDGSTFWFALPARVPRLSRLDTSSAAPDPVTGESLI